MKLTFEQIRCNVIEQYKQYCNPEHLNDDPNIHLNVSDEEQAFINKLIGCNRIQDLLRCLKEATFEEDESFWFIIESCLQK